MRYSYKTSGTCSREIHFEVNDGIVTEVEFVGGCNGNTKGLSALVKGMKAEDVIEKLKGIKCGFRNTSCPDQLSRALSNFISETSD
ncbi:MAG: TIGR03905 family TSCPD domain-containing protein [Clostridia bacterium]|nr:TIGR03905 family TSCPD domain-containing protein [Clostridia bacterium]